MTDTSSLRERVEEARLKGRLDLSAEPEGTDFWDEALDRLIALERAEAAWETASEWECACGQHERDVRIVAAEEALEAACAAIEGS